MHVTNCLSRTGVLVAFLYHLIPNRNRLNVTEVPDLWFCEKRWKEWVWHKLSDNATLIAQKTILNILYKPYLQQIKAYEGLLFLGTFHQVFCFSSPNFQLALRPFTKEARIRAFWQQLGVASNHQRIILAGLRLPWTSMGFYGWVWEAVMMGTLINQSADAWWIEGFEHCSDWFSLQQSDLAMKNLHS